MIESTTSNPNLDSTKQASTRPLASARVPEAVVLPVAKEEERAAKVHRVAVVRRYVDISRGH